MKIIFLDLDGVICTRFHRLIEVNGNHFCPLNKRCIRNVNKITDATDAKIVISSCWRIGERWESLIQYFKECGIKAEIIGKTPILREADRIRGDEIQEWLNENPTESFAIIDDDSDMGELLPFLVQTETRKGLTDKQVDEAIKILNEVDNSNKFML